MDTLLVYTKFNDQNKAAIYRKWLPILPRELRDNNLKFRNLDDRIRNLLGKLLLVKAAEYFDNRKISLNHICYSEFGRPYISPDFDFSISHSGSYVFCAISSKQIGIDVEKVIPLEFSMVKESMNEAEWFEINNAKNPLKEFYKYWTIKEAVIKANGHGFSLPLNQLHIKNNQAKIEDKTWYVQEFFFDEYYCGYNATERSRNQIKMIYIGFI